MAAHDKVYDVIVVGGGVMGSATAAYAKKLGGDASVLLLEQFETGHVKGSSHGDGRIFRLSYAEDDYVLIAKEALVGWRDLEAGVGEELLLTTGVLTVADESTIASLDSLEASLQRQGVSYRRLNRAQVLEDFPQYHIPESGGAVYQEDAGVLRATSCVKALWRWAKLLGAETKDEERMVDVKEEGGIMHVKTAGGRVYRGKSVVLAMGAWAGKQLGLPVSVSEEIVGYFKKKDESAPPDHTYKSMPVFLCQTRNGLGDPDMGYYGLPQVDVPGVKAATHHTGPAIDPDQERAGGDEAARERRRKSVESTCRLVAEMFPHCETTPHFTQTCLYTVTPDHDFILVHVAAGFSGHGFKFGTAIGKIMACMALGLDSGLPIERFRLDRFENGSAKLDCYK